MNENNSDLKINLVPFVLIAVAVTVFVYAGSMWNKERTKQKLVKMMVTSERIYSARKDQILSVLEKGDLASQSALIKEINIPEKGIYQVNFLLKDKDTYVLVGQYSERRNINSVELELLKSILSEEKSVSTDKDVFSKYDWVEDKIYTFTPIKNKSGSLVGYFVLGVSRRQDL